MKKQIPSVRYSMVRYSDESLRAIAAGTNPVFAKLAAEILAGRSCPYPSISPATTKRP